MRTTGTFLRACTRQPCTRRRLQSPFRLSPLERNTPSSSLRSVVWIPRRRSFSHEASSASSGALGSVHQPERKAWRAAPHRRPEEPVYELYFTCKTCKHRSGHSISKQGYHHGTVLVQCPGCQNRHLISDHLRIFYDEGVTLEDIVKEKGESVKLGSLDQQGDVELWTEDAVKTMEDSQKPAGKP